MMKRTYWIDQEPSTVEHTINTSQQPPSQTNQERTLIAFEGEGLIVTFICRTGKAEGETLLMAEARNLNHCDAEDFSLKIVVPKYIQMQQKPLSSTVIPANDQGVVTQLFRLRNNSGGEKETVVRLYVICRLDGEDVCELVEVGGLDEW